MLIFQSLTVRRWSVVLLWLGSSPAPSSRLRLVARGRFDLVVEVWLELHPEIKEWSVEKIENVRSEKSGCSAVNHSAPSIRERQSLRG